jgi:FKBP-type peptidyl-prolyl cis-trans isomerase
MKSFFFLLVPYIFLFSNCQENNPPIEESLLKVQVVHKTDNCGTKSRVGDIISIQYTGTFLNGTRFDSRFILN